MAKKKITAGMLGGRKRTKSPEDIEKAVQSIHQKKDSPTPPALPEPVAEPTLKAKEVKKPTTQPVVKAVKAAPSKIKKKAAKKPDLEKEVRFSFNMKKPLHRRLKIRAINENQTMADFILNLIRKELSKK